MKITFYGAAREVTGSQHMISVNNKNILFDCGFFQGKRKESMQKNRYFPYDPCDIDAVVLSHAHIDHSGNIPNLVKQGFQGKIYSTFATRDLCNTMLKDSAFIQEHDIRYFEKHKIPMAESKKPIYTLEDAEQSMYFFSPQKYYKEFNINKNINATFFDAGHVLGSAVTLLQIREGKRTLSICYTGDLGRKGLPILRDPDFVPKSDFLIIESTYGNREHEDAKKSISSLSAIINETAKEGGKIIIPSFALERTQELIYDLHILSDDKRIPDIPIFIDSPLACNLTEIFSMHPECYDKETNKEFTSNRENPFGFGKLKYTLTKEESQKLNSILGPAVIISASGMCEAGRIRHHIKNNIEDPRNTILIVGYMAKNTLGRKLVDGAKEIKIFGDSYRVKSRIKILNSFSAHADKNGLDDFSAHMKKIKKIFVVHGEEDQAVSFSCRLKKRKKVNVFVPYEAEEYEV